MDLLPDLIVREAELLDYDLVTDGRRVILRLATATANVGTGPLRVVGVLPVSSGGSQSVNQIVIREDGSHYERPAGSFEYHPTHRHVHLEDWAVYRLRRYLEGGAVGEIVSQGGKTSFCLLDTMIHDAGLPGAPPLAVYSSCGDTVQGISVGWADYYHRFLYGQNIDVLGLPHGSYWLEVEVDPENHILEIEEGNNIARVRVEIDVPLFIDGPLEVAPPSEMYHPSGPVDLLVGFRPERRFHRGENLYFPARQLIHVSGTGRRSVRFFSAVENEDHHRHDFKVSVTRGEKRLWRWSHYETESGTLSNISAAIMRGGHRFPLGAESTAAFRSVGKRSRGSGLGQEGYGVRAERLILQVEGDTRLDRAHVLVSD